MTFTTAQPQVPTRLRQVEIQLLWNLDEDNITERRSISYRAVLVNDDNQEVRINADAGDLLPILQTDMPTTVTQLQAFIDMLVTKARIEFGVL